MIPAAVTASTAAGGFVYRLVSSAGEAACIRPLNAPV